ncbi:MAG: hypothetical protein U0793_15520 [Gemmataceae bacterium]
MIALLTRLFAAGAPVTTQPARRARLGIETLETRQTPSGFGSIGHALQSVMHQISHIQASLASQLAIDHISLGHAPVNGQAIHGNIPQSVIDHLFS